MLQMSPLRTRPEAGHVSDPLHVYVFRDNHFAAAGNTLVRAAARAELEQRLGSERMKTLFGGIALYASDTTGRDYLGVWGARNASWLRRLLRQHGAQVVIHAQPPPNMRLRQWMSFLTQAGA